MEEKQSRLRAAAVIAIVAIALLLAAAGMVIAIRQTQALARQRIEDLKDDAEATAEQIDRQAVSPLDDFLQKAATNVRNNREASPFSNASAPSWVDRVYVFDGDLVTWERSGRAPYAPWRRATAASAGQRQLDLLVMGWLTPALIAAQIGIRSEPLQFVNDVVDGRPLVLGLVTDSHGTQGPRVVAARIDLSQFTDEVVKPNLVGNRIIVEQVLPPTRAMKPWSVDLGPLAPYLRLRPTPGFVQRQQSIVLRQTLFFLGGTALAMAALLTVIWVTWRVFNREIALSRMKQSFVADVSHELKTPLALIRLFGETLRSGRVASEDKRQEYYEIITRESDRLTHLINNILDFARIDAGRKRYNMQSADVGRIVEETYEAYQVQLDHEGFEHQLNVAPRLPRVVCDRDAVAQALINLINNAIKYTETDKSLVIDVSDETRRGRNGVLISVSDRGIGIKPEDRDRLFTDFYRADDERVRQKRGAGLGLALVKHIVDAHGGIVDVEPRLVKGSTFRIFLPANGVAPTEEEHEYGEDSGS